MKRKNIISPTFHNNIIPQISNVFVAQMSQQGFKKFQKKGIDNPRNAWYNLIKK